MDQLHRTRERESANEHLMQFFFLFYSIPDILIYSIEEKEERIYRINIYSSSLSYWHEHEHNNNKKKRKRTKEQ
jgi:hypothetical protein